VGVADATRIGVEVGVTTFTTGVRGGTGVAEILPGWQPERKNKIENHRISRFRILKIITQIQGYKKCI